jgi:hypothetical protein
MSYNANEGTPGPFRELHNEPQNGQDLPSTGKVTTRPVFWPNTPNPAIPKYSSTLESSEYSQ